MKLLHNKIHPADRYAPADFSVNFRSATRKEIDELLSDKLSDVLNHKQKQNKIDNLITSMRQAETIINTGSRKAPRWILKE